MRGDPRGDQLSAHLTGGSTSTRKQRPPRRPPRLPAEVLPATRVAQSPHDSLNHRHAEHAFQQRSGHPPPFGNRYGYKPFFELRLPQACRQPVPVSQPASPQRMRSETSNGERARPGCPAASRSGRCEARSVGRAGLRLHAQFGRPHPAWKRHAIAIGKSQEGPRRSLRLCMRGSRS